jgi:DNA-binding MarR family transcriptional regulator
MPDSDLLAPRTLDDLFLYRLSRLLTVGGTPVVRLCEGRYGITRREWRLIMALADGGTMLSSALAERMHLARGPTSKAVTEMVAKGLVARRPRPSDRRLVEVELTDAGRSIFDSLFPVAVQVNTDLLAALQKEEVDLLNSMLARLQRRAEANLATAILPKADRRRASRAP